MTYFLSSELPPGSSDDFFHIIPVPLERTVSYGGGTAAGPAAILAASDQLELWDGFSKPADLGIYTKPAIDCSGDVEIVMNRIADSVQSVLQQQRMPIVLGGEHSVTWGVIKGYLDAGVTDIGVVQIDAHADLRYAYKGDKYSHASVMHRVVEQGIPLYQLGVRAYSEEERDFRQQYAVYYRDAHQLVPQMISEIILPENFPKRVFFTIDVDGFDPAVFPSTGTPVPGGLGWYQTLHLFESVARQRHIVGFDIMEFAPVQGFHVYDFAAALLCYQLMGIVQRT